jgi:PAS domain S-box-containing protein
MNLLIVDDNLINLKLLRAQLEAEGHVVFEAHDGVDALALLERQRVDVVISDILMPRMDGYRLCYEIRKHARLRDLPIILHTFTFTSPGDEKLALDMGADKYFKKPVSVETIITALHEVIAQPHAAQRPDELREVETFKNYNERLVSKLKEKNTELQAQTEALRQSEDRYRLLFENNPLPIWLYDLETLRFLAVNESALQHYSYTREEFLAMTIKDIRPPEDIPALLKILKEGSAESKRSSQCRHRRKDGSIIQVEIISRPLVFEGRQARLVLAADITEKKLLEEKFFHMQRLEAIGTLAGGVAHDLNNALAPIMMGVELLKMQYPKESQILDTFETSAKRGADMVRQLLTFAKGAEGERVLLRPGHLVKELEKLMKGSFPKNIQLVVKCNPNLPAMLGDATQLHQVLLNLCVNARDAMPHGGTLTLEAQSMEVDAVYASSVPDAKPGKYVALRVCDTGTGIPPEILDRIFDPFFTTKGPDKGTGLGLSTVMGIVKGHGGFLQVSSPPGQGSTFTAYLPAADAGSDTELVTKAAVEFRGQGETILFVDDEPAMLAVARAVLRRLNFKPLTATDGADGLIQAVLHRTELCAIIADLHMPHMDGLAFVRALRRILPDIPITVASGRMEDAVAGEFKTLGVTSRLDKPFTEVQLAEALKNLLAPK